MNSIRRRRDPFPLSCSILFAVALPLWALAAGPEDVDTGPAPKTLPRPEQGTISPSGKFVPAHPSGDTNATVPKTAAEAEAELKRALKMEKLEGNAFRLGQVEFDRAKRTVSLPARIGICNQAIEYALVTSQGKAYESLLVTDASPTDVHLAFLLLGVSPSPPTGDFNPASSLNDSNALRIDVSWQTNGGLASVSLADLVTLKGSPIGNGRPMAVSSWLYNGSVVDEYGFAARREGSLVSLIRDSAALINNPATDRDNDKVHFPTEALLPPTNTPIKVTFRLPVPVVKPTVLPPDVTPITPLSTNYSYLTNR